MQIHNYTFFLTYYTLYMIQIHIYTFFLIYYTLYFFLLSQMYFISAQYLYYLYIHSHPLLITPHRENQSHTTFFLSPNSCPLYYRFTYFSHLVC